MTELEPPVGLMWLVVGVFCPDGGSDADFRCYQTDNNCPLSVNDVDRESESGMQCLLLFLVFVFCFLLSCTAIEI